MSDNAPAQMPNRHSQAPVKASAPTTVTVECSEHIDLPASCARLLRGGDDLMDRWIDNQWVRMLDIGDRLWPVKISQPTPRGPLHAVAGTLDGETASSSALQHAVAAQFVYSGPQWPTTLADDPKLAARAQRYPGSRPIRISDPLYSLVRSITGQQVNTAFATRIRARLATHYGILHQLGNHSVYQLDAAALAKGSISDLMSHQLSRRKAEYIVDVAQAIRSGTIEAAELARLDTEAVITKLTRIRGVGRWTAEWFAARVLGRPVVVAGDLSVRKAIATHFGYQTCSERHARAITRPWGSSSLIAQHLLLETSPPSAPAIHE